MLPSSVAEMRPFAGAAIDEIAAHHTVHRTKKEKERRTAYCPFFGPQCRPPPPPAHVLCDFPLPRTGTHWRQEDVLWCHRRCGTSTPHGDCRVEKKKMKKRARKGSSGRVGEGSHRWEAKAAWQGGGFFPLLRFRRPCHSRRWHWREARPWRPSPKRAPHSDPTSRRHRGVSVVRRTKKKS